MADKTDGSVVLAQLQAAFLWECVITRDLVHSPKLGGGGGEIVKNRL